VVWGADDVGKWFGIRARSLFISVVGEFIARLFLKLPEICNVDLI